MKTTPEVHHETYELYRDAIPLSNYDECRGCHTGSAKCVPVHIQHTKCPCTNCLVKTSCTEACKNFIEAIIESVSLSDNLHLNYIDNTCYSIDIKHNNKKINVTSTLYRFMDKDTRDNLIEP